MTGEFPAQMASYAENVSIWWRHHGTTIKKETLGHYDALTIGLNTIFSSIPLQVIKSNTATLNNFKNTH